MSREGAPGEREVLAFGTYDLRRHPRFQVVLEGLREDGVTVEELNHPLGLSTAERVRMLSEPWRVVQLLVRLLGSWAKLVAGAARRPRAQRPDVVLVGYLGHFDVLLARVLFPRARIVLDQLVFGADTARDRRSRSPLLLGALRLLDRVAVAAADRILVDTPEHLDLVPRRARDRAVVVPVGAPRAWYRAAGGATPSDVLRIVFFGTFTPLQGTVHIADALARLSADADCPPVSITMIGDGQDGEEVRRRLADVDVRWSTWVDSDALPGLVASHDVCLGIFGTTPKAQHVVPNKVYQGLAAGMAIVTSDTPPQRAALADAAVYVPAGDARALTDALVSLAREPERVAALRRASRERGRRFAPDAVARPLLELLRD